MRLFGRLVYDIAVPGAVEDTGGEGASIYDVRTKGGGHTVRIYNWFPLHMTFLTLLEVKTRREGVKKSQNRVYVIYGSPQEWMGGSGL